MARGVGPYRPIDLSGLGFSLALGFLEKLIEAQLRIGFVGYFKQPVCKNSCFGRLENNAGLFALCVTKLRYHRAEAICVGCEMRAFSSFCVVVPHTGSEGDDCRMTSRYLGDHYLPFLQADRGRCLRGSHLGLSSGETYARSHKVVEPRSLELLTSCVPRKRSPN